MKHQLEEEATNIRGILEKSLIKPNVLSLQIK